MVKEYDRLKKLCESEVKNGVKDFEKNIAINAKKYPKMVYSYINSKKVIKDSIRALYDEEGKRVEDPGKIVNILNNQFKSVFEEDNGEIPDVSGVRERVEESNRENGEFDWGNLTDIDPEVIMSKIKKTE